MRNCYRIAALIVGTLALNALLHAQWIKQQFPTTEVLYKVRFANSETGWILGANYLYKTTDGGLSWLAQKPTTGYGQALYVLNSEVLFHANFNSALERSTDGGSTWDIVDTNPTAYFDFEFINPLVGYAAGGEGSPLHAVVRKTTDGGSSWTTVASSFSNGEIEGISFINESVGWAVSYWSLMYGTTNAGVTWNFEDSVGRGSFGVVLPVRDVQFVTADSGWAAGGLSTNNVIARTTNGGATWTYLTPGGSSWRELHMRSSRLGWIVGATYAPYIVRTVNGGESWEPQTFSTPPNPSRGLESIYMIDDNLGWAVGGLGDVYKTSNGGAGSLSVPEPAVPQNFSLAQNYPNPFNPTTTINFSVPSGRDLVRSADGQLPTINHVTLKVFDVLGREVATLVDEVKNVGEHSVQFDASSFSSGVYYYRLQAGDYIDTKKMILIR